MAYRRTGAGVAQEHRVLEEIGKAVGREMLEIGVSVWLALGLNIHRNSLCGRNFEYYSEDPVVSGKMAACAEEIEIASDGSIQQVELTSQGLNGAPFPACGIYLAAICCNLTNGKMPHQGNGIIRKNIPFITGKKNECIVVAVNGTKITYKYFDFSGGDGSMRLRFRSNGNGKLSITVSGMSKPVGIGEIRAVDGRLGRH